MTDAVTASFLQKHADTTFMLDQAAAGHLTPLPPALGRRLRQLDAAA